MGRWTSALSERRLGRRKVADDDAIDVRGDWFGVKNTSRSTSESSSSSSSSSSDGGRRWESQQRDRGADGATHRLGRDAHHLRAGGVVLPLLRRLVRLRGLVEDRLDQRRLGHIGSGTRATRSISVDASCSSPRCSLSAATLASFLLRHLTSCESLSNPRREASGCSQLSSPRNQPRIRSRLAQRKYSCTRRCSTAYTRQRVARTTTTWSVHFTSPRALCCWTLCPFISLTQLCSQGR